MTTNSTTMAGQRWGPALGAARPRTVEVDQPARAEARRGSVRAARAAPIPARRGPAEAARRGLHGRGEGGQGVAESAAGRLERRRRRVQPGRCPVAAPRSCSARRPTRRSQPRTVPAGTPSCCADPAVTAPAQPLGQRGGDDLDPVPAAGDTPAGQQHVGAPAVGAAGPPRGQPRPPAVEQRHHPGPGVRPRLKPARRAGRARQPPAARSASARSGSRYSSTAHSFPDHARQAARRRPAGEGGVRVAPWPTSDRLASRRAIAARPDNLHIRRGRQPALAWDGVVHGHVVVAHEPADGPRPR